jgi:hypothetical protein
MINSAVIFYMSVNSMIPHHIKYHNTPDVCDTSDEITGMAVICEYTPRQVDI